MDIEEERERLLQTDRDFSNLSVEINSAAAFYHYMDENGLVLPKSGAPEGKHQYRRYLAEKKDVARASVLSWEPLMAEVSRSGDLGYTHGRYTLTIKDSSAADKNVYGYYITVWKRQADGSWKFVLDAGNECPQPNEREWD